MGGWVGGKANERRMEGVHATGPHPPPTSTLTPRGNVFHLLPHLLLITKVSVDLFSSFGLMHAQSMTESHMKLLLAFICVLLV